MFGPSGARSSDLLSRTPGSRGLENRACDTFEPESDIRRLAGQHSPQILGGYGEDVPSTTKTMIIVGFL